MQPPNDARFIQVVRRHFHFYAVAGGEPDKLFAHFSGDGRQYEMPVSEFDAKHGSGQDQLHRSFDFDGLFFQMNKSGTGFDPVPAIKWYRVCLIAITATSTATFPTATATAMSSATKFTPATSWTFLSGLGDVDSDIASIQLRAVHGGNGFLRLLFRAHGDEGKTT